MHEERELYGIARRSLALTVALAVLALAFGITAGVRTAQANQLSIQLNAGYARAIYEGAELMRGVESNLRKLTVSASGAQLQEYLNEISRQAQGAENAITTLPFSGETMQATTKVINQTGDFAASLSDRLARGGAVTEADIRSVDTLIAATVSINAGMNRMIGRLESGEALSAMSFDVLPVETEATNNEAGEYPTLIYDGPFSDASETTQFKALTGGEVTAEQAQQILIDYMGADQITEVRPEGESEIPVAAYEFSLRAGDVRMFAAVTRQGGKVLYVLLASQIPQTNLDEAQCVRNAEEFLVRNGYGEMSVSYFYRYQNVMTVNFAAVQDGVLLYPDLVKVQVSMADGRIVGVESANYLKNHTPRTLPKVQVTEEEALSRINSSLTAENIRLALIPLNTREKLTYEVAAKDAYDNQYLVYIDAVTGQEQKIYQMITDDNGTLAW